MHGRVENIWFLSLILHIIDTLIQLISNRITLALYLQNEPRKSDPQLLTKLLLVDQLININIVLSNSSNIS